jgi:hypothetical protein
MSVLPGRNAWQSGEEIKKYEISSNKTAALPTNPSIRPGEQTVFKKNNSIPSHLLFPHPIYPNKQQNKKSCLTS